MSAIKPKLGKCVDCPSGSADQPLIAGRCQRKHYWAHRAKVSAARQSKKPLAPDKNAQHKALNLWFANQVAQMPKHCENCGEYLNPYAPWGAKAYIAHILPKRHFKSVQTHPDNRMFLCVQCHANYDNRGANEAVAMPVFSIALE